MPGVSLTPSTEATACGRRSGSESGASSTSHAPPSKSSTTSLATRRAKRVLPESPGQVSVSRRCSERRASTSEIFRPRQTKLESSSGRLLGGGARPRTRRATGRPRIGRPRYSSAPVVAYMAWGADPESLSVITKCSHKTAIPERASPSGAPIFSGTPSVELRRTSLRRSPRDTSGAIRARPGGFTTP